MYGIFESFVFSSFLLSLLLSSVSRMIGLFEFRKIFDFFLMFSHYMYSFDWQTKPFFSIFGVFVVVINVLFCCVRCAYGIFPKPNTVGSCCWLWEERKRKNCFAYKCGCGGTWIHMDIKFSLIIIAIYLPKKTSTLKMNLFGFGNNNHNITIASFRIVIDKDWKLN